MTAIYLAVLKALVEDGVHFVVTGGAAIALHGYSRPVADLDVVVEPVPAHLDAAVRCLTQRGFWPSIPVPISMVVVLRMMDAVGHGVDVNRLYPIPYEPLHARAAHIAINGCSVAVASVEDLITVKRQRARDYDLVDLKLLEAPSCSS